MCSDIDVIVLGGGGAGLSAADFAVGASVLGARAGEFIGELALGMRNGITLRQISDTIHAYPTYGSGVRRAADQWYVRRRYPGLVKTLKRVFGFRGPVIESDPGDVL